MDSDGVARLCRGEDRGAAGDRSEEMKTNCTCTQPDRVCDKCNFHCDGEGHPAWFPVSVLDEYDLILDDDYVLLKKKHR